MGQSKGRRVPLDPAIIRKMDIVNEDPSEAAWDRAMQQRTLDAHVIAAGVVQNSSSHQYHTWVSLYGADLTSWYVGPDPATAGAILLAIQTLFQACDYSEDWQQSAEALMLAACDESTDPTAVLPDNQVRELLAAIATVQQRKN